MKGGGESWEQMEGFCWRFMPPALGHEPNADGAAQHLLLVTKLRLGQAWDQLWAAPRTIRRESMSPTVVLSHDCRCQQLRRSPSRLEGMAFPAAPIRPGTKSKGELVFQSLEGATMVTTMMAKYPLRFIMPSKAGDSRVDCAWVFILYYGGGLVGGDDVEMTYRVGRGCTALLTTQGSTKVYKMPVGLGKEVCTLQVLHAVVETDATLALLPDATTCFKGARLCQRQELDVQGGGNLVFVDWYTCGRMGRGESWAFERFESHTRVRYDGQLMLWEPLVLVSSDDGGGKECAPLAERMGGYECFCVVVVLGPRMQDLRAHIRGSEGRPAFSSVHGKLCKPPEANLRSCGSLTSVCELGTQGVVFKAASQTTEDMNGLLRHVLEPLTHVIGVVPYTSNGPVH